MIYQWKAAAHVRGGVKAQAAGTHMEKLRKKKGALTAEIIVEDARSERSPLHPAFEWDDSVAAHEFRLDQARYVLRSVVTVDESQPEGKPMRAFVVVNELGEDAYQPLYVVMADATLRQQVLSRAKRELQQWEERYRDLEELADVLAAAAALREAG